MGKTHWCPRTGSYRAIQVRKQGSQKSAKKGFEFCVNITRAGAELSVKLVPMNKSSGKRILCSSYTFYGAASGRLPGMNGMPSDGGSYLCAQIFAGTVGKSEIISVIRKRKSRSPNTGAKSVCSSRTKSPHSSHKICKSGPLVSASIPAMNTMILDHPAPPDSQIAMTSMISRVGSEFCFVQNLNEPPEPSCQTSAMTGWEFKLSSCWSAGGRGGQIGHPPSRLHGTENRGCVRDAPRTG